MTPLKLWKHQQAILLGISYHAVEQRLYRGTLSYPAGYKRFSRTFKAKPYANANT